MQAHSDANQTTYDLVINLASSDALVGMSLSIAPADLAFLLQVMDQVIKQDIGNGKGYHVARVSLTNAQAKDYLPLIPHRAAFCFVRDPDNAGRSNLLILMQTTTKGDGDMFFNKPLLAPGAEFQVVMANHLFLSSFVLPPLTEQLKKEAKESDKVAEKLELACLDETLHLYQIKNKSDIALQKDHDPWISTIQVDVDPARQALRLYLDAKADVIFMNYHVDMWVRSWQQFHIQSDSSIKLDQIDEEHDTSTSLEWWKYIVTVLVNVLGYIALLIVQAIVADKAPDLGGKFSDLGNQAVQWPNQKVAKPKKITTPGHVVLELDVNFD